MEFIIVNNDGVDIKSTNYWDSDLCKSGIYYLSINAGAYRLPLPPKMNAALKEIESANSVIISRGPLRGKTDGLELLFEDDSSNPYCLHMDTQAMDRLPSDADLGWKGVLFIYANGSNKPVIEFSRVYYRKVDQLPYLKPVKG